MANLPTDQAAKFGTRTYYVRLPIAYFFTGEKDTTNPAKTATPTASMQLATPGVGHDNGSSLKISSQGFWEFWSSLP